MPNESVIREYLDAMIEKDASDLFLTVGKAPSLRIDHLISPMDHPALTSERLDDMVKQLLTDEQKEEFESTLELNLALELENKERFRVNLFRQRDCNGMVIRHIKSVIPSFEELHLPEIYTRFIMKKRGLFLMVGAAGSGKSTALAAMMEYRNTHGNGHIITIEDPIEFIFEHKNCIFTQREVGIDTYSYGIALKNALRQSPDVLMIGEIRDRETLESALLFCETGHLVVGTLHASNANQAIERMVSLFPEEMHQQVLVTLSQNLNSIASQRLVESLHGKRTLAYEILVNEGLVKVLIEEGKIKDLKEVMEKNRDQGMITFDQCLLELIVNKTISSETALREADNPSNLKLKITKQRTIAASVQQKMIEDSEDYDPESF